MEAVAGPASPAILHDTVGLSGAKLQQYSKQYDTYIASTKVARDSLRSNLQAIHSAYESGDRADRQKNERARWRSEHQDHGRQGPSSEGSNQ